MDKRKIERLKKLLENSFNDWLSINTKRNSFCTWEYQGKIYNGLDSLRRIWIVETLIPFR